MVVVLSVVLLFVLLNLLFWLKLVCELLWFDVMCVEVFGLVFVVFVSVVFVL